ncbi:MAG TPA: glycosyltransferase family 2 protein [Polyangia bacterium]|jgi:glycosyltransferase involved in cell wall biosynthesis|nr:glycosyltransferase family 2 protein [Polyangia bacterium]
MDISVVLPIYNERDNLIPLFDEIAEVLGSMGKTFEIIAVDDGSRDDSAAVIRQAASERGYLKAIFFRRNTGQSAAFDAGFRAATGTLVVTMDADRQNDPHDIPKLVDKLNEGFDLVTGWRKDRKDGFILRRVPSLVANLFIRKVTGTRIHDLGCSLKVYRKELTDEIPLYGEMHRFISVLADGLGARVGEVVVNHRPRVAGHSKYGLLRTVKVMLDTTTIWFMRKYQTKPIYVFGGLGALMLAASALMSALVLYEKFADGIWVHRNPLFLIAVTSALIGMQSVGTGILAELIVRTHVESQRKTSYAIASRVGFPPEPTKG